MASCTCPVYRPSLEEFRDFQGYLASIESEAMESGILKIIPPAGWWQAPGEVEEWCRVDGEFGECEIEQPVEQRIAGRQGVYEVTHHVRGRMSIRRLRERAAQLPRPEVEEKRSLRNSSGSEYERHERRFWQSLATSDGDGAIYGADEPKLSVFERWRARGETGGAPEWFLDAMEGEPLRRALGGRKLGGVTEPMIYVGSWRALFAWHVEDANLYSINLLHFGAPKSWYGLAPADARRFELLAEKLFPHAANECPHFLRHKMSVVSPKVLRDHGFRVAECLHHAGEIMITLPEAYHSGFNHGFNVAESTNFATPRWPAAGRRATVCCCQPNAVRIPIETVARKLESGDDRPCEPADCVEETDEDGAACEGDIVDIQDGWGRVHVKGSSRTSDTWVRLHDRRQKSRRRRESPGRQESPATKTPKKRAKTPAFASIRRKRCGTCPGCQASDCGKCRFCLDSVSRGGPGKLKQACTRRRCHKLHGASSD